MSELEKYLQIRREAAATGLAVALLIIVWCLVGFGLADVPVELGGIPLWALLGTVGIWGFALLLVAFLLRFVFKDMSLSEEK